MRPLPPVDMQLGHHHERSTARTDLALTLDILCVQLCCVRDCTKNMFDVSGKGIVIFTQESVVLLFWDSREGSFMLFYLTPYFYTRSYCMLFV